tara:strand:- start:1277 stop:1477 length:201 start_codon:yes stop_codon:yes gene_type:complete
MGLRLVRRRNNLPKDQDELNIKDNPKKKKMKKINKRGGGDFNIEMKIPKDMVNQGIMYGYKKGGQI